MNNAVFLKAAAPLLLMFSIGCSTVEPPTTLAAQARERIQQAERVGADRAAPLALREANQYLSQAEDALRAQRHKEATHLLEKSLVNAELAIVRTSSSKTQKAAEQIEQDLELLQEESQNRQTSTTSYE